MAIRPDRLTIKSQEALRAALVRLVLAMVVVGTMGAASCRAAEDDAGATHRAVVLRYREAPNKELCYIVRTDGTFRHECATWFLSVARGEQGLFEVRQRSSTLFQLDPKEGAAAPTSYSITSREVDKLTDLHPSDADASFRPTVRFSDAMGTPHMVEVGFFSPAWLPAVLPEASVDVKDTWQSDVPMLVLMHRGMDIISKSFVIPIKARLAGVETLKDAGTECAIIDYSYEVTVRESDFRPDWKSTYTVKCAGRAWFAIQRGIVVKKVETVEDTRDFDKSGPEGDYYEKVTYESVLLNEYCPK